MNKTADPPTDPTQTSPEESEGGPGWLPAIMAATALMGIIGFITCAASTWFLFQQRTDFAIRTLRGAYIGELEQSLLDPRTKTAVVEEIETLAADLERGKYEDWQAAEMMQALLRLPVLQWGEVQAVQAYIEQSDQPEREEQLIQLSRLQRAVERERVTAVDIDEALAPVRVEDDNSDTGFSPAQPLNDEQVREFVLRCKLLADREDIPVKQFGEIQLERIVRRAIERAATP